jgi:hypothetical protein
MRSLLTGASKNAGLNLAAHLAPKLTSKLTPITYHMHNPCHHFTRRSVTRSPSSEALTWARARASRDITVPIGTPWMSATSR